MKNPYVRQSGFTLIELIIVIVILGILSAVALPRFLNVQGSANASVVKSMANHLQKASDMINGKVMLEGRAANSSTTISDEQGNSISVAYGYPHHDWNSAFEFLIKANVTLTSASASCTNDFCVDESHDISSTITAAGADLALVMYPRSTTGNDDCFAYYIYDQTSAGNEPLIGAITTGC